MKPGELRAWKKEYLKAYAKAYIEKPQGHFILIERFEMNFDYLSEEKPHWYIMFSGGMGVLEEEVIEENSEMINEAG